MKNAFRYILSTVGMVSVLLYCVSATAAITNTQAIINHNFSEAFNMLLLGFGLIGLGTYMKGRYSR